MDFTFCYRHRKGKAATEGVLQKKLFLRIYQNLQKNTCPRVSLLIIFSLLKKRLWYWYFPVNFVKCLRTPFFTDYLRVTASGKIPSEVFYI